MDPPPTKEELARMRREFEAARGFEEEDDLLYAFKPVVEHPPAVAANHTVAPPRRQPVVERPPPVAAHSSGIPPRYPSPTPRAQLPRQYNPHTHGAWRPLGPPPVAAHSFGIPPRYPSPTPRATLPRQYNPHTHGAWRPSSPPPAAANRIGIPPGYPPSGPLYELVLQEVRFETPRHVKVSIPQQYNSIAQGGWRPSSPPTAAANRIGIPPGYPPSGPPYELGSRGLHFETPRQMVPSILHQYSPVAHQPWRPSNPPPNAVGGGALALDRFNATQLGEHPAQQVPLPIVRRVRVQSCPAGFVQEVEEQVSPRGGWTGQPLGTPEAHYGYQIHDGFITEDRWRELPANVKKQIYEQRSIKEHRASRVRLGLGRPSVPTGPRNEMAMTHKRRNSHGSRSSEGVAGDQAGKQLTSPQWSRNKGVWKATFGGNYLGGS
ncbi:uncharacterized protein SEPMUDRAFT_119810 [Sphaerulina musiva SO2202]|uniref:Uncharacterized protein n=1 Tax=Sphaerulina musiva (strain SO2202) TaxID=692275 RepID=M3AVJ8_SPHMS|nr:uncharacterized protein SEPMUDRAFT_119810 [Sphaerulina musiva SO2202]EMF10086.1 hypothetical protein SEPMUDRAFT_119810 [Sphaerulina musiva SO2202]